MGGETVMLVRRDIAGRDRYGNDVMVEVMTDIAGCSVQPMWGQEQLGSEDQVTERVQVFLPAQAVIELPFPLSAVDALRISGVLFEINGQPQTWRMPPTNVVDHVVLFGRRTTG